MSFGIANVAAITVICYLVGIACKAIEPIPDEYIPVIVGLSGGLLGAIAFMTGMPDFPAQDYITAVAVGIVSGLAATGANQITRQLAPDNEVNG